MRRFRLTRDAGTSAHDGPAIRAADDQVVYELANNLREKIKSVSPDEFYWQESHYDHDSRQGRELLFLMANHEWVRATSEIIDIARSDAIETTIKIDIDLGQITHEAFRKRTDRLWLPIAILPPETGQRHFEPDLFAAVTDAAGDPMPMLPTADLRHRISAAMAEIIAKMAVSHLPSPAEDQAEANHGGRHAQGSAVETRDERLLLSAAIYRMLRHEPSRNIDSARYRRVIEPPRIKKAKESLLPLLDYYIALLRQRARSVGAAQEEAREPQFNPELARRAIRVLQALAESVIVVVLVDQTIAPSVLTVRVPTRKLDVSKATWFKPWTWPVRPCGRLGIDMLIPTADADRQIQVNLPDGVSLERSVGSTQSARLDISVDLPLPWQDLSVSLDQVFASHDRAWPQAVVNSLVDLSRVKSAAALRTLRPYEVRGNDCKPALATGNHQAADHPHEALEELAAELSQPRATDNAALTHLKESWQQLKEVWQQLNMGRLSLFRNTLADLANPQTVVARADMIEDVSQRAIPRDARFYVDVIVDDRDYFSTARSSAVMSLILMIGVLCFLFFWPIANPKAAAPSPEVLAIVLTLFATVQAARIERPDRSTLRGQLFAIGNWLIAASMLPAITLAVALAFQTHGRAAEFWAEGCIVAQIAFLLLMWHGPLMSTGWPRMGRRRTINTGRPDYRHFEALRSSYWRITTAEALMIGRKAHGYVIWQKADPSRAAPFVSPELRPVFTWDREPVVPNESSSVLALLRSGTLSQAMTFVVFRGEPQATWPVGADARRTLDLDAGRLVPLDSVTSAVDMFVGVARDKMLTIKQHPLAIILKAATNKLIVTDAQLPVPAPVAGHDEMQWARVRVALRDSQDIRRLTGFLGTVCNDMRQHKNAEHVVAVQAVPAIPPRLITLSGTEEPQWQGEESEVPVLTSDLDIVNSAATGSEQADARTWHVLAICADARSNIESEIIQRLSSVRPDYQLTGLTYALLHGTAVIFLLVHEPQTDDPTARPNGQIPQKEREPAAALQADLCAIPTLSKVQVLLDEKLSRVQLGPVARYPLLRIRFRWQDQPQASLTLLDSLNKVLKEELKSIPHLGWSVSYARLQVPTGQVAYGSLAVRLHISAEAIGHWDPTRMEEIGRKIETAAALAAESERAAVRSANDRSKPDDPVINVERIKKRWRREGVLATADPASGSGAADHYREA